MKRASKIAIGVAAAALSLGLAATAGAQAYGPGSGMGGGMGMGMSSGMMDSPGTTGTGMMGDGAGMMGARIEERLAAQKSALKITSDQESAWQAYASAAQKRADQHDKLMKERFEQVESTGTAYKNLYAVLTPEQRAVFDRRGGMHSARGR